MYVAISLDSFFKSGCLRVRNECACERARACERVRACVRACTCVSRGEGDWPLSVHATATTPFPAGCQSMADTHLFFEYTISVKLWNSFKPALTPAPSETSSSNSAPKSFTDTSSVLFCAMAASINRTHSFSRGLSFPSTSDSLARRVRIWCAG